MAVHESLLSMHTQRAHAMLDSDPGDGLRAVHRLVWASVGPVGLVAVAGVGRAEAKSDKRMLDTGRTFLRLLGLGLLDRAGWRCRPRGRCLRRERTVVAAELSHLSRAQKTQKKKLVAT